MSTNSECEIVEVEPGRWFYVLEDYHAPKNAWDWREYASAYGPFTSEREADAHLGRNQPNPGGMHIIPYGCFKMSESYEKLIAEAPANMRLRR